MKNNISCKRNYMLEEAGMKSLLKDLNGSKLLNRQSYQKKNTVSFYDDDQVCYFILSMPDYDYCEHDIMDLVDMFGSWFGITA